MSVLIFGILNICFGLWGVCGPLFNKLKSYIKAPANSPAAAMYTDPDYVRFTHFSIWVGFVLGVALVAFGIGLLLMRNWARIGSMIYAVIAIVQIPITGMMTWPFMKRMIEQQSPKGVSLGMVEGIALIVMILGLVLALAYPVLLLFYMTRANVIEACQPEQPAATT
jgi:F0F1-type ATP synthase membrane subunit c/vacuolar-type H+-ATPase subunit K